MPSLQPATQPLRLASLCALVLLACLRAYGQVPAQPCKPAIGTVFTEAGLSQIKQQQAATPALFAQALQQAQKAVEAEMANGIEVPLPVDPAGGYTHARHKKNYMALYKAGALYQLTGHETYAQYIKAMLLRYAAMYPNLPLHPVQKSYARGKLFWQCLNEANWLLYAAQAYDCIYHWLDTNSRQVLEQQLFVPMASFLSIQNPQFFNRIHNHSTWACAAVGVAGLVMGHDTLVQRALYGLAPSQQLASRVDDDGGLIQQPGAAQMGFLAQIHGLFSPSGYYTEGPYYQRYALIPFMLFAEALQRGGQPVNAFTYRNGLLLKAASVLTQLTTSTGQFYPINDAQKGMSIFSESMVQVVNIAFNAARPNQALLAVGAQQGRVALSQAGYAMAQALASAPQPASARQSVEVLDGPNGQQGGIGILWQQPTPEANTADDPLNLVLKYTAQGMGHGHFDKLAMLLYHGGQEVLQDYGAARYVNIQAKAGICRKTKHLPSKPLPIIRWW